MMKQQHLVYQNKEAKTVTTSVILAKAFGRPHDTILKEIETLIEDDYTLEPCFRLLRNNSEGQIPLIYEINVDGFEVAAYDFKEEEDLAMKIVFMKQFNKLDPPILRYQQEITDKKQIDAILDFMNANHEDAQLFKKAMLNELNKRAKIIRVYQKEHFNRLKEQRFLAELDDMVSEILADNVNLD